MQLAIYSPEGITCLGKRATRHAKTSLGDLPSLALRRPGQDVTSGTLGVGRTRNAAWSGIDDAGRGEGLEGPYYHHFS